MSPEEIRVKIATLVGWTKISVHEGILFGVGPDGDLHTLPSTFSREDLIRITEKFTSRQKEEFIWYLDLVFDAPLVEEPNPPYYIDYVEMAPDQMYRFLTTSTEVWAEAILRTLKLWTK